MRYHLRVTRILVLAGASLLAAAAESGPDVVLIGDGARGVIMRDVAASERSEIRPRGDIYELEVPSVGLTLTSPAPGGAITALADTLHRNEIGLVVVDATRGPTPAVREHVLIARQARTPMLAVMLVNVARLHEKAVEETGELLALEIREMRELLAAYDFDANSVAVFYDAHPPALETAPAAAGVLETLKALSLFDPRRAASAGVESARAIWGAVYLLTGPEAAGAADTLSPNDSLVVWSEGTHSKATLASLTPYHPGDFREMPLAMDSPLSAREGSRILLMSGDRVVGLGEVTQIGR